MKSIVTKTTFTTFALITLLVFVSTSIAAGRKYALFVGINDYDGTEHDLKGAVNDSVALQSLLVSRFQFRKADTKLLTDAQATRANILMWLKAYGAKAMAGDLLVFQYSGHGSLVFDRESKDLDETNIIDMTFKVGKDTYRIGPDYFDSAIVPADGGVGPSWNSNFIIDDELYDLFAPIAARGVDVVFISDSCHSGTVAKGGGAKSKFFVPKYYMSDVHTFDDLKIAPPKNQVKVANRLIKGTYLLLAAAHDNQFALDSDPDCTVCNGLFTANLIDILKGSKATATYQDVMDLVADKVKTASGETQEPMLDARFGGANLNLFAVKKKGK